MVNKRKEEIRKRIEAEELVRRQEELSQGRLDAASFLLRATENVPWQKDVIEHSSLHKALFGERRGGKSTMMGIAAIHKALSTPFAKILYIGLKQDSCQRVMYDEVLASLKREYQLPAKLIGNDQMVFENGSIIYLVGLDANKNQKEKVRGTKASLLLIDEMQSYTQNIQLIIKEILGPTAADTKSAMIIGGTAGNALGKNYWYEITRHNTKEEPIGNSISHPEWMIWRCSWSANTAIDTITNNRVCDNVGDYLENEKKLHPGIELTPSWRQEWNAEWIVETSSMTYRYTSANLLTSPDCVEVGTANRIEMPSALFLATSTYLLGLDLGYEDPTAMVVCAYNLKYSNKLYIIESFSKSHMLIPEVAGKIKSLDDHYHFAKMVGDSSSLQVFETLRITYGLPIEKANRAGKLSHILVINSDFQTRSIVIMPGNEDLVQELSTLTWDAKALDEGKYVERQDQSNHIADSLLYCHNYNRARWYTAPKPADQSSLQGQEFDIRLTKDLFSRKKKHSVFDQIDFRFPNGRSRAS